MLEALSKTRKYVKRLEDEAAQIQTCDRLINEVGAEKKEGFGDADLGDVVVLDRITARAQKVTTLAEILPGQRRGLVKKFVKTYAEMPAVCAEQVEVIEKTSTDEYVSYRDKIADLLRPYCRKPFKEEVANPDGVTLREVVRDEAKDIAGETTACRLIAQTSAVRHGINRPNEMSLPQDFSENWKQNAWYDWLNELLKIGEDWQNRGKTFLPKGWKK